MTSVPAPADTFRYDHRRPPVDVELIVPTFNEEYRLPATLLALLAEIEQIERRQGLKCRIVVVDNGSWDRTAEVADQFALTYSDTVVVVGCSTGGKGAAVQRGVLTSGARWVGFLDADLAVPADALPVVLDELRRGRDVVIASRRCEGASYAVRQSALRRVGSWVFRQAIRDLLPGVTDTQCGFKFFSATAAEAVFGELRTNGFSFDVELLVRAHALGYPIHELPVVWSDGASSSLNPVSHGGEILRELLRLRRIGHDLATQAG